MNYLGTFRIIHEKQWLMANLKRNIFRDQSVSTFTEEVATRFSELVELVGGRPAASEILEGLNVDTLTNYSIGKTKPPFYAAAFLCDATGKSLQWLATGRDEDASGAENDIDGTMIAVMDELNSYFESRKIDNVSPIVYKKLCVYILRQLQEKRNETAHAKPNNVININDFAEVLDIYTG